jgi:hypothetical protein
MEREVYERAAGNQQGPELENRSMRTRKDLGLNFWLAFWGIAITNLAAAFDATMLSVALPVRIFLNFIVSAGLSLMSMLENIQKYWWD